MQINDEIKGFISETGKTYRYDIIWKKTMSVGFANSKKMPMRSHEIILVFYKHLPTYNPQGLIPIEPISKKRYINGVSNEEKCYKERTLSKPYIQTHTNYPKSVLKFSNGNNFNFHPTQKPLSLFEYLILTYTNPGNIVLDNCIGSGTTAVACVKNDRKFIAFETNEKYVEISNQRIKQAKCKKGILDADCFKCSYGFDNMKAFIALTKTLRKGRKDFDN